MTIRSGHNTYTQMHTSSSSFVKLWKCVLHMHVATLVPRMLHPLLSSTPAYHILLTLKYPNKHVTFLNTLFPELFSLSFSVTYSHSLTHTLSACLFVTYWPTTHSFCVYRLSVCLPVCLSIRICCKSREIWRLYGKCVFFSFGILTGRKLPTEGRLIQVSQCQQHDSTTNQSICWPNTHPHFQIDRKSISETRKVPTDDATTNLSSDEFSRKNALVQIVAWPQRSDLIFS